MSRTIQRPLPRGVVGEREALHFGITLLLSGLAITLFINFYVTLWGVLGSAFVLGYNWKLKRLTPWNVLIASPGGAAPVLGAYSAMTGSLLGLESILLALLIIFWTPVHIWSLAIFYDKDYRRAGVPMLPVVKKESIVNRMILFFSSLYLLDALALFLKSGITPSALLVFLLLSYPLIKLSIRIYYNYSPSLQLGLFKLSNLHLASVFLAHLFFSSL
jgi:protoheme IX farnesyltransferase